MPLLNYTTTIAAEKTLGEIQRLLAKAGARSIRTDFDENGEPAALEFEIRTPIGDRLYRLPADIDAIHRTLARQYEHGQVQRRFVTREQAARVGWRILKDWIEAQLALIETGMAAFDQVMLPYMLSESGRTVYELFEQRQLALPAGRSAR